MKQLMKEFIKAVIDKEDISEVSQKIKERTSYWSSEEMTSFFEEAFNEFGNKKKTQIAIRMVRAIGRDKNSVKYLATIHSIGYEHIMYGLMEPYIEDKKEKRQQFFFNKNKWLLDEILEESKTGTMNEEKLKRWNNKMRKTSDGHLQEMMKETLDSLNDKELFQITKNVTTAAENNQKLYRKISIGIAGPNRYTLQRMLDIATI